MKRKGHEHVWEVKREDAFCTVCGFRLPARLVVCVGCREPKCGDSRVYFGVEGPYHNISCREKTLAKRMVQEAEKR